MKFHPQKLLIIGHIFFFSIANRSKTSQNLKFLFHKNCSQRDLCIMTLPASQLNLQWVPTKSPFPKALWSHTISPFRGGLNMRHFFGTHLWRETKIICKTFQQLQITSVQFGRVNAIKDWKVFRKIPQANTISNEKTMKMVTNLFSRLILTE